VTTFNRKEVRYLKVRGSWRYHAIYAQNEGTILTACCMIVAPAQVQRTAQRPRLICPRCAKRVQDPKSIPESLPVLKTAIERDANA